MFQFVVTYYYRLPHLLVGGNLILADDIKNRKQQQQKTHAHSSSSSSSTSTSTSTSAAAGAAAQKSRHDNLY
jgi:hypothetical protein